MANFDLSILPKLNQDIIFPEKPTEELAEETGLHIGDGTMNFYLNQHSQRGSYSLRGHLIDDREHYDKVIKQLYLCLYDLKISLREMPNDGVYGFQKWSNNLVNFKHKVLGLNLGKKLGIMIPDIFTKKEEFMVNVIRGIFDTDGTLYLQPKYGKLYPRIEISTISKELGNQLYSLINKLGIRTTIYIEHKSKYNIKWNDQFKVSIRGDVMLRKWIDLIEPHNPKHIKKFDYYLENS